MNDWKHSFGDRKKIMGMGVERYYSHVLHPVRALVELLRVCRVLESSANRCVLPRACPEAAPLGAAEELSPTVSELS